jgi:hypothetical protein
VCVCVSVCVCMCVCVHLLLLYIVHAFINTNQAFPDVTSIIIYGLGKIKMNESITTPSLSPQSAWEDICLTKNNNILVFNVILKT